MLDDKEERIKAEAYRRWENEGRPDGEHHRHWVEAAEAVETNGSVDKADISTPVKASKVAKPKAAKVVAAVAERVADAPKRTKAKKPAG